jgi:hypothetical protein
MTCNAGKSDEQLVGDEGEITCRPQLGTIEASIGGIDIPAALSVGFLGIELDRSANGIHSGQRALGSAQNFDMIQVEHVENGARERRVVHVIYIHAHARLTGVVEICLAYTPDEGLQGRPEAARGRFQRDIGCLGGNLVDHDLPARSQGFCIDRRDRYGRVLRRLFAKLCCDGDFFERGVLIGGCRGCRRRCLGYGQRRHGQCRHGQRRRGGERTDVGQHLRCAPTDTFNTRHGRPSFLCCQAGVSVL